jgi:hypothetical protein
MICDFGDAKFGEGPFEGEIMPDLYQLHKSCLRLLGMKRSMYGVMV